MNMRKTTDRNIVWGGEVLSLASGISDVKAEVDF
jgi:hypothetical protein